MSMLIADRLSRRLGDKQVLDGVSAALDPGQVTAVIGPNGAGKSTLLEILAGLQKPDSGTCTLEGASIAGLPGRTRAQKIAFLPQTPEVAWTIDVRTLVGLGRTAYSGAWGLSLEDDLAVEQAIVETGLEAFADRMVDSLSGGERARALIARAIAGKPQWLLADEPLAGLDPGHALDAIDLFRKMAHVQGCGVVVTLHDLSVVPRAADRVLVIAGGQIIADGPPATALAPEILARAYGIRTEVSQGAAGPLIEVLGRAD
jgi:iron complex transport system ATP-binding protein